ncbi:insecticidal delta-endotoxin Cry8Ea1 family protein [Clostridium weizhouense]|uniref:Crystaline entomocidal protoxin n=1 Tax=Clostridium weizhouense TaxID=2859781 RepID=A0ABS7ASM2_9CLOT|nr:insecticidal delta-endotoxin Cry8Ea1 family protein [Clostridium weizhouense]MBW6411663.1 hypothetical protein [Clostridium weizhouense]
MDSNQNKNQIFNNLPNDKGILNSDTFEDDSDVLMKNIDYKDFMNEFESITPSISFAAIGIILNLTKQYISYVREPSARGGIGLIRDLVSIIRNRNVVNLTIDLVRDLILEELNNYTTQQANSRMTAINNNHDQYLNNLELYLNKNMSEADFIRDLRSHEASLRFQLDSFFSLQGYELLLLPNFVQVALYHLKVLQDGIIYGGVNLIPQPSNEGAFALNRPASRNFKEALDTSISIYTNHCTNWYNTGLNRLRGSSNEDWTRFNNYRTEMTIMVLDFVELFPLFDPIKYPGATNVELSRILYTEPMRLGTVLHGFQQTENFVTSPSNRAALLNNIEIFTAYYFLPNNTSREYWSGNINTLSNASSYSYGYRHNDRFLGSTNFNTRNIDIFKVDMTTHAIHQTRASYWGVHKADFTGINTQNNQRTVLLYNRPNDFYWFDREFFLPGESSEEPTVSNYTHKLFQIKTTMQEWRDTRHSLFSHAWLHKSFNSQNVFREDQISQIPAIKTNNDNIEHPILRVHGYTGGDLIKLDDMNSSVSYTLTPANPESLKAHFIIRLRYASMSDNVQIAVSLGSTKVPPVNVQRTVKDEGTLENLRYEDFEYVTFLGSFLMNSNLSIIRDTPNTELVIDKIELIPEH